ncbi:hypothetical protein E2C01_057521 [Portunus trituberculatus]|uniref:Uncharacterized protein n=1 Tax=Portunus trituberculatus TaxID=210409 RepID=A0A5B7H086_PORTR|nr:hypothetical protein [Portunus trituberculatus]
MVCTTELRESVGRVAESAVLEKGESGRELVTIHHGEEAGHSLWPTVEIRVLFCQCTSENALKNLLCHFNQGLWSVVELQKLMWGLK